MTTNEPSPPEMVEVVAHSIRVPTAIEACARAICAAKTIDPDKPTAGIGSLGGGFSEVYRFAWQDEAVSAGAALVAYHRIFGVVETDADGEAMACSGCGTTRTLAAIKSKSPTALSCCPERRMLPVRELLSRGQGHEA